MKKKLESILKSVRGPIVGLGLAGILTFSSIVNANPKPIYGFGHGPFRQGQSPETGVFPTELQVREDLDIIKEFARANRTYGNDNVLFDIPEICNEKDIDCYVGSWTSDDATWNQGVVDRLIQVSDANYSTTKALIVGNEYLLWRSFSAENTLIPLINQVKNNTDVPVTTAETYNVWLQHPNLVDAVDFIGAHIHPYWEGVHIDDAAQHAIDKYNLLKQAYPDKETIIFEVGWPSAGNTVGQAVPSEENQKKFIKDFVYLAKSNDIKYFLFEGFDEPWKQKYAEVEGHWGLYDKDRLLKLELTDFVYANPGDVNKDNNVDILDLQKISYNWLKLTDPNGPCLPGDINQDGITNFYDFSVLANNL